MLRKINKYAFIATLIIGVNCNLISSYATQPTTDSKISVSVKNNKELEKKINNEINKVINDYKTKAIKDIAEYKKAFLETGGTEKEFNAKNLKPQANYELKYSDDNILSFVLHCPEPWNNSLSTDYYYNIDLKTGKNITLNSLLGDDYINIVNKDIDNQIKERIAKDKNSIFWGYGIDKSIDGFKTITSETKFYINKDKNPVIVFDKYEIAPGSMGKLEFVIKKAQVDKINKVINDYKTKANKDIAEYKKAFLETGGTEKQFNEKNFKPQVNYELKYSDDNILSFVLHCPEPWNNTSSVDYYYNIDLKTGKDITLNSLLGNDYINIANKSIDNQIKERIKANPKETFFGYNETTFANEKFKTISQNQKFYINKDKNPLIVFDKYEIAPGSMGQIEFVIKKDTSKK